MYNKIRKSSGTMGIREQFDKKTEAVLFILFVYLKIKNKYIYSYSITTKKC